MTYGFRIAAAALVASLVAAPAHATGKKPTPSQQQYDKAIAQAKAAAAQKQQAAAGAVAAGGSGNATAGGDSIDGSWGFSYTDIPASVPTGVLGGDAAILSDSWKIGPLGGHASQELSLTPGGMTALAALVEAAGSYDGTPAGYNRSLSYAAVLCAKDPAVAVIRFGRAACSDLASIYPQAPEIGE